MIANFYLAVQTEESLKRLNFSRDMIERLGKNIIFLVTSYGDDRLANGANDFYSFVKLRVMFHNYAYEKNKELTHAADEPDEECEWGTENLRQKMEEAYALIEKAKDEKELAHYYESEKLLLKAQIIKEKLLGSEHLEIAEIDSELADVYARQGKYEEAEELYKKSLLIRNRVLGGEHPDTGVCYNNLASVYKSRGEYKKAEELYKRH